MQNKYSVLIFFMAPMVALCQKTIYVRWDASGNNNGTSWADAFVDLQTGLSTAVQNDQIWVAQGVYKPTSSNDRATSFVLKNGISIYGGFVGMETHLNERDVSNNICILSGDVGISENNEDNSFHVVYAENIDSTTLLDGFTIQSGNGQNAPLSGNDQYGGGMLAICSSVLTPTTPRIHNCSFTDCQSKWGGAMACLTSGSSNTYITSPIFNNCAFVRNKATNGGAIYKEGHNNPAYNFAFNNCWFKENKGTFGGAIYFDNCDPNLSLIDCRFEKDTAMEGACLFFIFQSGNCEIKILNSWFKNNYANSKGGSILIYNLNSISIILNLSAVEFLENTARYNDGGAISLANRSVGSKMSVIANDCLFSKNKSYNPGAAIEMFFAKGGTTGFIDLNNCCFIENSRIVQNLGTVISMRWDSQANLKSIEYNLSAKNCLFVHNKSVYSANTPWESKIRADFINCTFYNNGQYPFNKGWRPSLNGIDSFNIVKFANCIIWESLQPDLERIFYNNDPDNFTVNDYSLEHCILSNPDCSFNNFDICGDNVLHGVWPNFIDTIGCSDFGILMPSPAFNSGSNSIIDSLDIEFDYIGNSRIYCDTVDLGAIEVQVGCQTPTYESVLTLSDLNPMIWPNPSSNHIWFSSEKIQKGEFTLWTLFGHQVLQREISKISNMVSIELPELPSGIYLWKFTGEDTFIHSGKVIIRKD
jgi:hypothetical protein